MMKKILLAVFLVLACASCKRSYDVCVYGGTAAAVVSAYSAAQMGMDVIMVSPDVQIGGMTSGGLGFTDIGNKQAVSGVARQFYRKVGKHYGKLEQWVFEPHVAEEILESYLDHPGIKVLRQYRLEDITVKNGRISTITVKSEYGQKNVSAKVFIDCTYEGDLMALSGVSYTIGRESNVTYHETYDGVQLMTGHQFPDGVDPFVERGNPESGLVWGVSGQSLLPDGSGDSLVQAYNYRICLTDSLENMIPITRPDNYDSTRYELALRLIEAQPDKRNLNDYFIWSRMPGRKTDINNRGGFSTDMIGMNYSYPDANYALRKEIIRAHTDYTKGLLYFYGHDSRVPKELREQMLQWGYPKDEYVKTDNWTPQLYVRESRRMIGEYTATQADCEGRTSIADGVAYAAYNMDSHNCQRIVVVKDGIPMVKNEGNVEIPGGYPYPVSYRCVIPKRDECVNLLVPVCLSASHIAYGSIRMEPVFMALGQACGVAAALSVSSPSNIQDVDVDALQAILSENPYLDGSAPEILIDDTSENVLYSGSWSRTRGATGYGPSYLESKAPSAEDSLIYRLPEDLDGDYSIYSYQQIRTGLNEKMAYYVSNTSGLLMEAFFDMDRVELAGQTSGEWFYLGDLHLGGDQRTEIRVERGTENKPTRADAILLIKR
ncbi:MAG: FAD-dependent oxidoreductase [Bacteroidales bacterium]|nr:FAD-dependent oxidoreductase [Bacteroidales bacterium]